VTDLTDDKVAEIIEVAESHWHFMSDERGRQSSYIAAMARELLGWRMLSDARAAELGIKQDELRELLAERDTLRAEVDRLKGVCNELSLERDRLQAYGQLGDKERCKLVDDIDRLQSKYHAAVALLRRCVSAISGIPYSEAYLTRIDAAKFIATIDAEEATPKPD
jgi:chromosome segregation ATPase